MKLTDKLTFGKFQGKTIEEIWFGSKFSEGQFNQIIQNYVAELIEYCTSKSKSSMTMPPHSVTEYSALENDLQFLEGKQFKLEKNNIISQSGNFENLLFLRRVLNHVFEDGFFQLRKRYHQALFKCKPEHKNSLYSENTEELIYSIPKPNYIEWSIFNVEHFFIDPENLEYLLNTECRYISRLKVKGVNPCFFIKEFEEKKFSVSQEAVNKNRKKWNNRGENKFTKKRSHNNHNRTLDSYSSSPSSSFCSRCHQSPCMCSDPY